MSQTAPPRRILANVAVAVYVGIQLLLPLRGLSTETLDSEIHFSWSMFSERVDCVWGYAVLATDGSQRDVDLREHVHDARTLYRVFRRDALPRYHEWLCENVVDRAAGEQLFANVRCRPVPGDLVSLVRTDVDVCADPGWGMRGAP